MRIHERHDDGIAPGHGPRESRGGRRRAIVRRALGALLAVALAAACAGRPDAPTAPPGKRWSQSGKASWYGPQFHGRATASGERFDMHLPSAAHRSLPFGTVVRVDNLDNGRSIEVRINDRGPFVRGRILDLSRAAAAELGMLGPGIANVRVRVVAWPGDTITLASSDGRRSARRRSSPGRRTILQAGAFRERELAERLAEQVRRHDRRARVYSDGGWHRVQVRGLADSEVARLEARLAAEGIATVILEG